MESWVTKDNIKQTIKINEKKLYLGYFLSFHI